MNPFINKHYILHFQVRPLIIASSQLPQIVQQSPLSQPTLPPVRPCPLGLAYAQISTFSNFRKAVGRQELVSGSFSKIMERVLIRSCHFPSNLLSQHSDKPATCSLQSRLKDCIILIDQYEMTTGKQYVISLNRLIIPPHQNLQRITLSVSTPSDEHFIQNEKFVKDHKINFYRENLFVKEDCEEIRFRVYGIDQEGGRALVKTLEVEGAELRSVHKRPTMFHTKQEGYELMWDGWIFTEESSYIYQESEKDYTELDLPFYNQDDENLSQVLGNSHSQNSRVSKFMADRETSKKRSNSTEETTSLADKVFEDVQGSENKGSGEKEQQHRPKNGFNLRTTVSFISSVQKRKKTHIKSQLYSSLMSGISELLSPTKV